MESRVCHPLLKKPSLDVTDFKNFRPITNLTTVSKILERLALARLKPHVVSSPNFNPLQSAYRVAHSTETAMVKIVDDILALVDSSSAVALIGLDISVAFDTVSHSKLLARLETEFGIEGAALGWIDSYLLNRTFFVHVGDSLSAVVALSSGVSQGSVLGPILFTGYVPCCMVLPINTSRSCDARKTSLHAPSSTSASATTTPVISFVNCTGCQFAAELFSR